MWLLQKGLIKEAEDEIRLGNLCFLSQQTFFEAFRLSGLDELPEQPEMLLSDADIPEQE